MAVAMLTGFEPFAGAHLNPSAEIARSLDRQTCAGHRLIGLRLPCVFGEARARLSAEISLRQPDVVIALGLAANRNAISVERLAVNLIDAPIPDNAGVAPRDRPVVEDGPAAYFSTLPVRRILAGLRAAKIPAEISLTAGSYVCNELFYGLMHTVDNCSSRVSCAGFIHVPALPGQFAQGPAGMALDQQIEAIRIAIVAAFSGADQASDMLISEGRTS